MIRKARPSGSSGGSRLRLTLLLATAAAFFLVSAAAASAAVGDLHVKVRGEADGRVVSDDLSQEFDEPIPPIDCNWDASEEAQTGVCDAKAFDNEGTYIAVLKAKPPAGSVVEKWVIEAGTGVSGCGEGELECRLFGFSEIKVKVLFKPDPINTHITIVGSGSGRVFGVGGLSGTPPVNCEYVSPGPQTGACDVEAGEAFGGAFFAINVEHEAAPGSEFAGWEVEKGGVPPEACEPLGEECFVLTEPEIKIKATFNLEPPPTHLLTVTKSGGTGTGTVTSSPAGITCGVDCNEEYNEGTVVTLSKAADAGSEFKEWTGACSGSGICEVTMSAAKSVNAKFDLESVPFSVTQTGEGSVECEDVTAGGGLAACAISYPYGHTIKVVAAPVGENVIGSLIGSGSAAGKCEFEATSGSCEFSIEEPSGIEVSFAAGNTIDTEKENVHGEVPQTTELASSCAGDVDLGTFKPGEAKDYEETCALTVTSTGKKTSLTAADETGNDTGYLTQKPIHPYSLPSALQTRATGLPELENPGTPGPFTPLTSPVTLLTYGGPVSADNVTVYFKQHIGLHDALHTGVYSKMITLTLKQTTP